MYADEGRSKAVGYDGDLVVADAGKLLHWFYFHVPVSDRGVGWGGVNVVLPGGVGQE